MRSKRIGIVALSMAAGLPCAAQQVGPEVVFTELATAPTAKREVPGLPAGTIFESTTSGAALDRPYASPNGQYWAIKASSNLATTTDDVILFWNGSAFQLVAQEGTATPFDAARNWGLFDNRISINNGGSFAFANNLSDPTTDDEIVSKYDLVAGVPTWVANPYREGAAAADAGATSFIPAGSRYGLDINSPQILADGAVCVNLDLLVDAAIGMTSTNNGCLYRAGVALQREAVTAPNNQTVAWDLFDVDQFELSADGSIWVASGNDENNTAPALDAILVVNNEVMIREGTAITGLATGVASTGVDRVSITPSGDWLARGLNTDVDEDWVVRNGTVVACRKAGHPANSVTGGPETWGNTDFAATFFLQTGNNQGDYVIGGVTSDPVNTNGVIVLDRAGVRTVVMRESAPIDVDGNGLYDDNAYIRTFGNDDALLTSDGWLYVAVTLTNDPNLGNTGPDIGDALLRLRVFTPTAPCYANCDGSTIAPILNVNDFICFQTKYAAGDPTANCDGSTIVPVLNVNDFICFQTLYAAGCP